MAKQYIFPQSILYEYLKSPELENEIRNEISNFKTGVVKSNVGGFQTPNIKNKLICETIIRKSFELISTNYKFKTKTNIVLDNMWININKKNDFNTPHTHPHSNFSGVYYLDVPEKKGELIFMENDKRSMNNLESFLHSDEFWSEFQIKPKKDMILLFPSSLVHMVRPHYEDGDRISLSFNIKLELPNG